MGPGSPAGRYPKGKKYPSEAYPIQAPSNCSWPSRRPQENPVVLHWHPAKTSDQIPGNGTAKDKNKYTGTNIMGIAAMHKSNLVPVTNKKSAEDISKMRRG